MAAETPDPLPNWQPPPPSAATDVPDPLPQRKGILDTSYQQLPSAANGYQGIQHGDDPTNVGTVRSAFGEGYGSVGTPSVTREGVRSMFTPETQREMGTHWWGPLVNFAGDVAGTGVADIAGVGNSAITLANEALRSVGVPEPAIRDLNVEATRQAGEGSGASPSPFKLPEEIPQRSFQIPGTPVGPFVYPKDMPAMREFMEPPESLAPTPSLTDVAQTVRRQRNAALDAVQPPDPTSQAMIEYLTKRPWDAGATPSMPQPPEPFTTTPGPAPAAAPGPGLLSMQPPAPLPTGGLLGKDAPVMSQADMQSIAKGHYSPADQAAAANTIMTPAEGDAIRGPLMDHVPTDPQTMAVDRNKPVVDAAITYAQPFMGQDMSIDMAMKIDRDLSSRIRATKDPTDKANLITAQNGVRDAMEQSPVFQSQPDARQAWSQSIKQGQIEDIEADVATRDEGQQDARRRTLVGNLLRNDTALRSWSPDEVAQLQQLYDQSKIGSLKQLGINLIKPVTTATGAGLGAWMGGPTGGFIGSRVGEQGGDMLAAAARRRAMSIDLTPVSQRLTANMPPPPAGWQTPAP